ncbi:2-hydroxyacid dehydrogenase [Cupriavidus numazuensis]|uniref:2-ketogluconate reductase n=1 Tax=Cupriavidus numazuensis TaxID=221992 RepID=A0ABM8TT46_9BURK|nr:2-hydroxyacid dehydrogenase [Cupriavidus numazuensis]CAG2159577.1 2-ketogluconate reductase [Cupriavidus numazuensis]
MSRENREDDEAVVVLSRLPLDQEWLRTHAPGYCFLSWQGVSEAQRVKARAVLTNGSTGMTAAEMAALPALELVASFGAGYENIDRDAARARGVQVCHAPDTNAQVVADHALALMLAWSRGIAALDRRVKAGDWETLRAPRPGLRGKTLGVVGLGNIGGRFADLAEAVGMRVAYLRRSGPVQPGRTPYGEVRSLASASDVLALTCPGGPATRHLVDADVLRALGPDGLLVNVARGSVVDTEALVQALRCGEVGGAALDVLDTEPLVPEALRAMDQVVLTPHMAGRSPETRVAQHEALVRNLEGWFRHGASEHPV